MTLLLYGDKIADGGNEMICCFNCNSLICKEHSFIPKPEFNPIDLTYDIEFHLALCINCNSNNYIQHRHYSREIHELKHLIEREKRNRAMDLRLGRYLIGQILRILNDVEKHVKDGLFYTCNPDYYWKIRSPMEEISRMKLTKEEIEIVKDWINHMKEEYNWRSIILNSALGMPY